MYGDPYILKVKLVRVKFHEYFSMTLDYTKRGEVQKYMKNMTDGFPVKTGKSKAVTSPSTDNIFKVDGINPLKKNY